MTEFTRIELASGEVVCERCLMATTVLLRLRGLAGRKELHAGEGILLRPCGSVHTFFMRFPIDVVFCDGNLRVLAIAADVPKRRLRGQRHAKIAIELASGEAECRGLRPGDELRIAPL